MYSVNYRIGKTINISTLLYHQYTLLVVQYTVGNSSTGAPERFLGIASKPT